MEAPLNKLLHNKLNKPNKRLTGTVVRGMKRGKRGKLLGHKLGKLRHDRQRKLNRLHTAMAAWGQNKRLDKPSKLNKLLMVMAVWGQTTAEPGRG